MAPRKIGKKNDNELLHEKENENKLKKSVEIVATYFIIDFWRKNCFIFYVDFWRENCCYIFNTDFWRENYYFIIKSISGMKIVIRFFTNFWRENSK